MATSIQFDWDPAKAVSNLAKHGVAFEDAMLVFSDPLALSVPDPLVAGGEERWITIGLAGPALLLLVVHTHIEIDAETVYVRIISATNRDLFQQTQTGSFRPDLYYRLHVVGLRIPPLSARTEDIPEIFELYLKRFAGQYGRSVSLTPAARELLKTHIWPGNIRQLRNIAEVVAYGEMERIDARHISEVLGEQERSIRETNFITIPESSSLKQMELEIIRTLLAKHSADEVCSRLGISRVTLWRKMKNMPLSTTDICNPATRQNGAV